MNESNILNVKMNTGKENSEVNLPSVNVLGVNVHSITMEKTLDLLIAMAKNGSSHQVVTVNPEFIMTARKNQPFRDVLNNATIALPDGIGVVLAAKWLGQPVISRITGVDLVEQFAKVASKHQLRLFFLGSAPGVAEMAADRLCRRYPGLIIAGTYAGSPHPDDEEEICRRIKEASPHALFVAYGAPNQDLWIARNLTRLKIPIAIGIGGSFDFIAGVAVRAPQWVQQFGLEWLHRLIRQPSRWKRMTALPRFAAAVLLSGGKYPNSNSVNLKYGKKKIK